MSDDDEFEQVRWDSGINWHLTVLHPTLLVVQGEVVYLLVLVLYFPSWLTLKVVLSIIAILALLRLGGYSIVRLIRRWNRFRVGRERSLYSARNNLRRMKRSI